MYNFQNKLELLQYDSYDFNKMTIEQLEEFIHKYMNNENIKSDIKQIKEKEIEIYQKKINEEINKLITYIAKVYTYKDIANIIISYSIETWEQRKLRIKNKFNLMNYKMANYFNNYEHDYLFRKEGRFDKIFTLKLNLLKKLNKYDDYLDNERIDRNNTNYNIYLKLIKNAFSYFTNCPYDVDFYIIENLNIEDVYYDGEDDYGVDDSDNEGDIEYNFMDSVYDSGSEMSNKEDYKLELNTDEDI